MRVLRWVAFALGCAALLAAFGLSYWRGLEIMESVIWALLGVLGVAFLVLLAIGLLSNGERGRWASLSSLAALLVGFSALSVFSIGLLIAPFALFLLVVSLWKLARSHSSRRA